MNAPTTAAHPASFTLDPPERIANWRPLVQWLLAIPHFIVAAVLGIVAEVASVIAWFAIVFTGRMPAGLTGVLSLSIRYSTRAMTYAGFLHETYPPFTFATESTDPGDLPPVRVDVTPALENRNRVTVGLRLIMVIPHLVVLTFVFIAVSVCWILGFFAVLFTGRWPAGLLDFIVGAERWRTRVQAYSFLLNDEFPPFSLD